MGIQGLTTLIKKYAPNSITKVSLESFRGRTIAIDTSILLYKFRYSNNSPQSHIYGFLRRCLLYGKYGITPVFVIDGKPPPEKDHILKKRKQKKEKLFIRIKELQEALTPGNRREILSRIKKLKKQYVDVTRQHHDDIYCLLRLIGVRVIMSTGEAEDICAQLQKGGLVDYIYSEDTDLFPLGGLKILREEEMKTKTFSLVCLNTILKQLKLEFSQFIDLCILCGCDYCPSIPRLGSVRAYELLIKLGSLEEVLKHLNITQMEPYIRARKIYTSQEEYKHPTIESKFKLDERSLRFYLGQKGIKPAFTIRFIREFKKYMGFVEECRSHAKLTPGVFLSNLELLDR